MSDFTDEAMVNLRGGDGGAGAVAFRREPYVDRGGPDGGDGGKGGDVWLAADRNVASLIAFRDHPHRRAASGAHGSGNKRTGATGADLVVPVPEGTIVRDRDGAVLADLVRSGDRVLAARGGQGGRGNAHFLSNARRAPGFAEQGEYGEERWLRLELRLIADVDLASLEGRSPADQERILLEELGRHEPALLERPRLVVGTKADVASPDVAYEGLRISAVTRDGLGLWLGAVSRLVDEARAGEGEA